MACLETDAYDHNIYWTDKEETDSFMSYVKSTAKFYRKEPYEKILALSTCDDATTSGRTILVCAMTTRTDPLPDREYGKPIPHRQAVGHPMAGAYWALVNLLILCTMLYFALRYLWLTRNGFNKRLLIAEFGIAGLGIIVFGLTENMHKPIQMVDIWTPVMIILLAAMWGLVWFSGQKKEATNDDNDDSCRSASA